MQKRKHKKKKEKAQLQVKLRVHDVETTLAMLTTSVIKQRPRCANRDSSNIQKCTRKSVTPSRSGMQRANLRNTKGGPYIRPCHSDKKGPCAMCYTSTADLLSRQATTDNRVLCGGKQERDKNYTASADASSTCTLYAQACVTS